MKHLILFCTSLFLLLGLQNKLQAQALELSLWPGDVQVGESLIELPDGSFVICGKYTQTDGNEDAFAMRVGATGATLWSKTWGDTEIDVFRKVIILPSNTLLFMGETKNFGARRNDHYFVKTDFAGNEIWSKIVGLTRNDAGYDLIDAGGGTYVAGGYQGRSGVNDQFHLLAIDSSGSKLWEKHWGTSQRDQMFECINTLDGGFFGVGESKGMGLGKEDCWVMRFDAAGDTLWTRFFGDTGLDRSLACLQNADSSFVILSRETNDTGVGEMTLRNIDKDGNFIWKKNIELTAGDIGYDLLPRAGGGYIAVGGTFDSELEGQLCVTECDALGNVVNRHLFGGLQTEFGREIIPTSTGGFAMVGFTEGFDALENNAYLIITDGSFSSSCPSPEIWVENDSLCVGNSLSVKNVTVSSSTPTWKIGGSTVATGWAPFIHFPTIGSIDLDLEICGTSSTQTIHVVDTPNAMFTFSEDGPLVHFTSTGSGFKNLQWFFGDGNTETLVENPSHHYPHTSSTYKVTLWVEDFFGCSASTSQFLNKTFSNIEKTLSPSAEFFPNPSPKNLKVKWDEGYDYDQIVVKDMMGKVLLQTAAEGNTVTLDLQSLSKGSYLVELSGRENLAQEVIVKM